jgi:uncharacterized protein YyaL (SSP411 family)
MGARSVDFFERVLLDGRGGFQYGQVGDTELYPAPNGLAIRAYARWAAVTGEKRYLNFAFKSIERVWEHCWDSSGGLLRRGTFGEVLKYPQLEDQVEMGLALLGTYQVAKRPVDLDRAKTLGELLLVRFEDPRGGFRTQSAPNKSGEVKKAARVDFENARAARFLYELAAAVNDDRFRQAANRAWVPFLEDLGKGDLDAPNWALAARASWAPTVLTPPEWPIAERTTAPTFQRSFTIKSARRKR